eukprot:sb/3472261/
MVEDDTGSQISESLPPSSSADEDDHVTLFDNVNYMGRAVIGGYQLPNMYFIKKSSALTALEDFLMLPCEVNVIGSSVSNVEANAIIAELHEYNTESKVTISVPANPDGCIKILDEQKELLHSDDVRSVLYVTKSAALPNCFAFTSGKKDRGMFYCHAFKCKDKEVVRGD